MIVFVIASVVVIAGLAVGIALGRLGGRSVHLAPATSSSGAVGLPDGPVTSDGVSRVTFDRVARGYRMDQVDEVIDRLHDRLAELESTMPRPGYVPATAREGQAPPDEGGATAWRTGQDPAST